MPPVESTSSAASSCGTTDRAAGGRCAAGAAAPPAAARAAGGRAACAAARSGAGCGAAAELGEDRVLEEGDRPEGEERGERLRVRAKLVAEVLALLARLDVLADRARALVRPSAASASSSWTSPQVSRRAWLDSARVIRARTRSDLTAGTVVSIAVGDLGVGESVDLAQEERGPLGLWQVLDVGEDLAQVLAGLDGVGGCRAAVVGVLVHHLVGAFGHRPAQMVQAAVAGDPVEPRLDLDVAVVLEDRLVGRDEDVLEHILRVLLGGKHVPAEGEQARLVAIPEGLERPRLTVANHRDQLLVALKADEGRPADQKAATAGMGECGCLHGWDASPPASDQARLPSPHALEHSQGTSGSVPGRPFFSASLDGG